MIVEDTCYVLMKISPSHGCETLFYKGYGEFVKHIRQAERYGNRTTAKIVQNEYKKKYKGESDLYVVPLTITYEF